MEFRIESLLRVTGKPEPSLGIGAYGNGTIHKQALGPATERPSSAHAEDPRASLCLWRPESLVVASWAMLLSPTLKVALHANKSFHAMGMEEF